MMGAQFQMLNRQQKEDSENDDSFEDIVRTYEKEAAPHKATGSSLDDSLNRGDHTLHLKGHQKDLV